MAKLTSSGNIVANCDYTCEGVLTTYEWLSDGKEHGLVEKRQGVSMGGWERGDVHFRLFRCAGCGAGALGAVAVKSGKSYRDGATRLLLFKPEAGPSLDIPDSVPADLKAEFREAEECLANGCYRAASALFRSTLDKAFRAAGYKLEEFTSLKKMIDLAGDDGVITETRRLRAHDEVRALGNDILHEEWRPLKMDDVRLAHHYTQRILEDLYDDRETTLKLVREKDRVPAEDQLDEDDAGSTTGQDVS